MIEMRYFGQPWRAQWISTASKVDTPIGDPCTWCDEPIKPDDRGAQLPHFNHPGTWVTYHAECQLRVALGSMHEVTSHGGRVVCEQCQNIPPYPGTRREEALAILAIVNDERKRAGYDKLL